MFEELINAVKAVDAVRYPNILAVDVTSYGLPRIHMKWAAFKERFKNYTKEHHCKEYNKLFVDYEGVHAFCLEVR
jgi:hypothetical protein